MTNTTIFYYTNNVIPKKLFEKTIYNTINLAKNNDCELIVTSHYPITENYNNITLSNSQNKALPIHNYIVKDLIIPKEILDGVKSKFYVTGQMPYSYESIIKQILFSEEVCSGEKIILMEHDCLYPTSYISIVNYFLDVYDTTYTSFTNTILNKLGYFKFENRAYVLSSCSFKRSILKSIYRKKLELHDNKKRYIFEPCLLLKNRYFNNNEIIIEKHLNIDTFLKTEGILDIKHNLNTDGMLISENYSNYHNYWGDCNQYIDLIDIDIEEKNKKIGLMV